MSDHGADVKLPRYRDAKHARRLAARVLMRRATQPGRDGVAAARALATMSRQLEVDEARRDGADTLDEGDTLAGYLRARLAEVRADVNAARAAGSHQAVVSGARLEVNLRQQLQAELDKRDDLETLDEGEYLERLRADATGWPDSYFEAVVALYEQRHRVRAQWLRVVDGERV